MTGWTVFFIALGLFTVAAKALEVIEYYCN